MSQKNLNSSISCKIMLLALCNSEHLFKVLKDSSVSDLVVSERAFVFYVIYNKATINSLGGGGKLGIK